MTTKASENSGRVNPKKFSLWLLLLGILMLFSGLTSAYIVRKGDGNWFDFEIPPIFLYSTIIVLLSSVTMIWAYRAAKKDNISGIKFGLSATIILGIAFMVSQYNTLQISMCNTYWHFVGFLWVYLYMFLYFAPDF
ncbi:MAG: hypothetical protein EBR72_05975 [Bacteroidetes bacterium]|nr:hypothetical protein [Bacteroidota bacterium]